MVPRELLRDALGMLGVRRLLLGVHPAALPVRADEDPGRGAVGSDGAAELLALASELGFDGLQLGPEGATTPGNASPYDGTLFSRAPEGVALAPLARAGLLADEELAAATADRDPARVRHEASLAAVRRALDHVVRRFRARRAEGDPAARDLDARLRAFLAREQGWLVPDALYEVLASLHGGAAFRAWPARDRELSPERREALVAEHAAELEAYALVQLLAEEQHAAFRARAAALGLALFADLQVGMSDRDAWRARAFLLAGWRMGAPPSRTNPEGQAWGFEVLDPDACAPGGAAVAWLRARAARAFAAHDGLRVDHPHGLVCPWVYPVGDGAPPPALAVRAGARLHESPEHPVLGRFAIARPEQLDLTVARHDDARVTALDEAQVQRYATLVDAVVAAAPDRDPTRVVCEVLSTQPYPLARVLARHRLGRFRVTQKADVSRPGDVYRGDAARPEDWIMLGNHDTRPIRALADRWIADGHAPARGEYLAARLLPRAPPAERAAFVAAAARDPSRLAQASFAELFVGPARQVQVYFTDLLGSRARYNAPGTVGDENWSLRIPADVRATYAARLAGGEALDVAAALATALRARGDEPARALAEAIDRASPRSPG